MDRYYEAKEEEDKGRLSEGEGTKESPTSSELDSKSYLESRYNKMKKYYHDFNLSFLSTRTHLMKCYMEYKVFFVAIILFQNFHFQYI